MKPLNIRPRAEADIDDIWRFTAARWSVERADDYFRGIVEAIGKLGADEKLGRACDDIRPGYRRFNVASHVIFYRVDGDAIDIIRVLHGRRDFRRHLPRR